MNPPRRLFKLGAAIAALLGVDLATADDRRRAAFVASLVVDLAQHPQIGIPDDVRHTLIETLAASDTMFEEIENAMIAAYLETDPESAAAAASSPEDERGDAAAPLEPPGADVIGDPEAVRVVEQAIAAGRASQAFPPGPAGQA
jgi:hypothetical protein